MGGAHWRGRPGLDLRGAAYVDVSRGYFATMGIPVLRGREFTEQDAVLNPKVILINETMARREFSAIDPIGRRFSFGPGDDGKAEPVSPPRTLDAVVGASFTQRRFNMTLLVVFAAIALVLAIAGIYGTVAYSVAQRTQEIGIRVALGATAWEILGLVLVGALKPVIGGLVIGVIISLAATRAMDSLLYGVTTTDPLTFVLLPIVLGVVAFMAGLFPALRATRVDPLEALRVD